MSLFEYSSRVRELLSRSCISASITLSQLRFLLEKKTPFCSFLLLLQRRKSSQISSKSSFSSKRITRDSFLTWKSESFVWEIFDGNIWIDVIARCTLWTVSVRTATCYTVGDENTGSRDRYRWSYLKNNLCTVRICRVRASNTHKRIRGDRLW